MFRLCLLLFALAGGTAQAATPDAAPDAGLAALRRLVEMQQRGTPDYAAMEPPLRQLASRQSARMAAALRRMGRLESLALLRRSGAENVYELWFEHGRMLWGVTTSPAGRFARVRMELREHCRGGPK